MARGAGSPAHNGSGLVAGGLECGARQAVGLLWRHASRLPVAVASRHLLVDPLGRGYAATNLTRSGTTLPGSAIVDLSLRERLLKMPLPAFLKILSRNHGVAGWQCCVKCRAGRPALRQAGRLPPHVQEIVREIVLIWRVC